MKFENTEVWGWEHAIRGMRNPLESWNRSDSKFYELDNSGMLIDVVIGDNDLELMQKLIRAGSEHRKYMRQIFVSVDITAPLYWWKEFDTYKVGTTSDSTSTMHKLASTPITIDFFEFDDFDDKGLIIDIPSMWNCELIPYLERIRKTYIETKDKRYWKELIRLLPESWLQKRTITMSYENVLSMVRQRKNHKLTEWSEAFIGWAHDLPYAEELLFLE